MPKRLLTARRVESLKPTSVQTDYWDQSLPGFSLRVSPGGRKAWVVMYRRGRRLRRMTIGAYPALSLADARAAAKAALHEVATGDDPATAKHDERTADTIGTLAAEYVERHAKRRKRTWKDDERILKTEILPAWRHRAVDDIRRRDVRELVEAIADRGAPILANRVLALVRKMFNFAIEREWTEANPAAMVRKPGVERQRDRVLTEDEIRTLWEALKKEEVEMAAAFKLRLITAQRGGEVVNMRWQDLDLKNSWWTIPAEHSKNKLPHRVPLTMPAREILQALRDRRADDAIFVLTGARGKRQRSEAAKRFGLQDFRGHDLRRTAASSMASAGVPRLVIAKILNHVERDVTRVYDRHGYDDEKRQALEIWARKLEAIAPTEMRREG